MISPKWLLSLVVAAFVGALIDRFSGRIADWLWFKITKRPKERDYIPVLKPGEATIIRIGGKYYKAVNKNGEIEVSPLEKK